MTSRRTVAKLDPSLLNDIPPFARLSVDEIREILAQATSGHWGEGTAVFNVGDRAERFFLLLDGTIRVVRTTSEGDQVVPLHIPAGQLFGIAPAFGIKAYPATAIAAVDCLTLSWPSTLWQQFVKRYEGFATETWATIGGRMQELHARIEELATRAVEQRIASVLLQMANQSGRMVQGEIEIGFPITRATMAEMTGTTLHTVSRMLSALEREGVVASTRKHVKITDPHRLVLISGDAGNRIPRT